MKLNSRRVKSYSILAAKWAIVVAGAILFWIAVLWLALY